MEDDKKNQVFATTEFLWAYVLIGLFIVGMFLRFVWAENGFMVEEFGYQRLLTIFSAIVFGFGFGWLLYPRRLRFPAKD